VSFSAQHEELARGSGGRSRNRVSWLPLAISAGIDLLAVTLIFPRHGHLGSYCAAAAFHLAAVSVAVRLGGRIGASRRWLAGALVFALPVAGAALAAVALATRPRSGLTAAIPVDHVEPPMLDAACFHKIAEALSPCEVLSEPGNDEGWATLAALTRRGDGESVRLLRWLVLANPNMAVDAALALEELSVRFDSGLESRRMALAATPSAESAFEEAAFIGRAMQSGLVDPVMLNSRAAEARRCFALARQLDPGDGDDITLEWGRMELAAMRPEAALSVAEEWLARPAAGRKRLALVELCAEARWASHLDVRATLWTRSFDAPATFAA
jgi:hypothetical protein